MWKVPAHQVHMERAANSNGIHTPAAFLPVQKSKYILDESDEEVQRTAVWSSVKRSPEENGFYMPDSPFCKIAEEDGLDFNSNKKFEKAELSLQQKANDVFEEHHQGRRWAEKLALMARKTGAFRALVGVKTPLGGYDEDGVDLNVTENQIADAKEKAKRDTRVAARKLYDFRNTPGGLNFRSDKTPSPAAKSMSDEKKRIKQELLGTIGRPNLPTKQRQGDPKLSPSGNLAAQLDAVSTASPLHGM